MANSRAIDKALVDVLAGDAALRAILPDGVFMNQAPQNAQRFVVVTLFEEHDAGVFGARGWESTLYLVKIVGRAGVLTNIYAAEARLDTLLDDGTLTIPGYAFGAMFREQRVRFDERDELDPSILWFHGGGYYRIHAAPDDTAGTRAAQERASQGPRGPRPDLIL